MALSNLLAKLNHLPTFQVEECVPSEILTESPQCLLGIRGFLDLYSCRRKMVDSLQKTFMLNLPGRLWRKHFCWFAGAQI